jgi:hypothetical protein
VLARDVAHAGRAAVQLDPRFPHQRAKVLASRGGRGSLPEYRKPFIDCAQLCVSNDIASAVLFLVRTVTAFGHGRPLVTGGRCTMNR